MPKKNAESSAQDLFGLWLDTYKATIGKFAQMPTMGPAREQTERALKGTTAFADLFASWMDSTVDLQGLFMEATRRTQEKVAASGNGEKGSEPAKDIYEIWTDEYKDTLSDFMRSKHFANDQGKLVSDAMELQQFNRDMFEENYLKPLNIPTKSDIDDTNKEIYLIKRKLKELIASFNQVVEVERTSSEMIESIDLEPAIKEIEALNNEVKTLKAEIKELKRMFKDLSKMNKDLVSLKGSHKELSAQVKKLSKKSS